MVKLATELSGKDRSHEAAVVPSLQPLIFLSWFTQCGPLVSDHVLYSWVYSVLPTSFRSIMRCTADLVQVLSGLQSMFTCPWCAR